MLNKKLSFLFFLLHLKKIIINSSRNFRVYIVFQNFQGSNKKIFNSTDTFEFKPFAKLGLEKFLKEFFSDLVKI